MTDSSRHQLLAAALDHLAVLCERHGPEAASREILSSPELAEYANDTGLDELAVIFVMAAHAERCSGDHAQPTIQTRARAVLVAA